MSRYHYVTCCVHADGHAITEMVDRARTISWRTFWRYVSRSDTHAMFGYSGGLTLENDYAVPLPARSRFNSRPCVFLTHSAIEYVFCPEGTP